MSNERSKTGTPMQITAWVCDECGYWRQEQSTGIHQTYNRADPRGAYVKHVLREARFVEVSGAN